MVLTKRQISNRPPPVNVVVLLHRRHRVLSRDYNANTVGISNATIGFHGAILPLVLAPLGFILTRVLDFPIPHVVAQALPIGGLIALIAYYLVWKYVVQSLNGILGLA